MRNMGMHVVGGGAGEKPEGEGLAAWLLGAFRSVRENGWAVAKPARKHMRVVETLAVGPRKHVVLVSCDGERFLIGTGPESVGTITRVRPEAEYAGTLGHAARPDGERLR